MIRLDLSNGFTSKILDLILVKCLKKKFGNDVKVHIGELKFTDKGEFTEFGISIDGQVRTTELTKFIEQTL